MSEKYVRAHHIAAEMLTDNGQAHPGLLHSDLFHRIRSVAGLTLKKGEVLEDPATIARIIVQWQEAHPDERPYGDN